MVEVKITYETLFDLLRREKSRSELQRLDENFYADVVDYLNEKNKILKEKSSGATFSGPEREKIKIQIKNIKKILQELYEFREKKILQLAMHKVRTGSSLIDTSGLLKEEKGLFEESCLLLRKHRANILDNVFDISSRATPRSPEPDITSSSEEVKGKEDAPDDVEIVVLSNLPKFVGLDKEIYGPYEKDQKTVVPWEIASLLIQKGRAKKSS